MHVLHAYLRKAVSLELHKEVTKKNILFIMFAVPKVHVDTVFSGLAGLSDAIAIGLRLLLASDPITFAG